MKVHHTHQLIRGLALMVGGPVFSTGALDAAPFLYAPGDLVLAFRQTGNASDYAVNIGKASDYSALPPGTSLPVANLSLEQLKAAFPTVNGLAWSVGAASRPPLVTTFPLQTIWTTGPRVDPGIPSPPWLRKGQFVQGTAASQIDGIGNAAAASSNSQPAGPNNTATGVVIPSTGDFALGTILGDLGNYAGTFQGSVESVTADDFDADPSNVSRADLYELIPGTTAAGTLDRPGQFLGYFEFKPDGSLTFNNSIPAPPRPTITSVTRTGNTTAVSFQSVAGANYRLRFTDALGSGSPLSTWSQGASSPGTGSILTLEDTQEAPSRFYAVEVRP